MIPPHFKTKRKNISRLVLSVVITLILITTALGTTATIQTSQTATPQTITQLSYSFSFQEPTFNTISVESATYTLISLDGCMGLAQIAGEPKLPRKFVQLLLPPATTVTDIHISSTSQDATPTDINLLQSPVIPQQPSVPFGMESPDFIMDEQLYTTNQPQPDSLLQDYQIGYNHGYTILSFALTPVQYTPSQGTVTYHPEISVSIDLEETTYNQLYRASKEDKLWVQNLVSNPEMTDLYTTDVPTFDYPGGICDPSGNYDYVIITTTHNDLDYWTTGGTTPYNWESLMDKHSMVDSLQCTLVTIQAYRCLYRLSQQQPTFQRSDSSYP